MLKERERRNRDAVSVVDIGSLSQKLSYLHDMGVLTFEEEAALSALLDELRTLLARAGSSARFEGADRHRLSGMARLLAADLDLAYQRLNSAA